jgi:hypothetical protein
VGRHQPAPVQQVLLAGDGRGQQPVAGRQPDRAHERGTRDAHAGQVSRRGPAVGDVPVHLERVGKLVTQEAEPGQLDGESVPVRLDVQDLDGQQVAGLRALDVDRPGQRVDHVQVRGGQRGRRHPRGGLPVERVPGLQHDLVTRLAEDHRRDVRVPPVVPGGRLLQQRLAAVDADLVTGHDASL